MKCGPGPRRLVPRTWTACKRTCQLPLLPRMERTSPRVRPRLPIAAARNLCSWRRLRSRRHHCWKFCLARSSYLADCVFGLLLRECGCSTAARHRWRFPLALLMLVPLGAFYLQVFDAAQVTPPNLEAFSTGESTVEVAAHVTREGIVRDSPFGGKQESVDVETEELAAGDHQLAAPVGIRLTIYSKRADEEDARRPRAQIRRCRSTPTASGCVLRRNYGHRETTAIPGRSIWSDILRRRGFGLPGRPARPR